MAEDINYWFIEEELEYFLNVVFRAYDSRVADLLPEDRVFPFYQPRNTDLSDTEQVQGKPAIIFRVSASETPNAHTGAGHGVRKTVAEVAVQSSDYLQGVELSEFLINFADGYTGNMRGLEFQGVYVTRSNDDLKRMPYLDEDKELWTFTFNFTVWWDYIFQE